MYFDYLTFLLKDRLNRLIGHRPAPSTSNRVNSRNARYLLLHETGFYKNCIKDENGLPRASSMYWNTNPPTPCPGICEESVFDAEFNDVGRYEISTISGSEDYTHLFNRPYRPGDRSDSRIRSVKPTPDYDAIKSWLRHCESHHQECCAEGDTDKLKIVTLIDVRSRQLVPYVPGMKYLTLSYVWGRRPDVEFHPQVIPSDLPATIRHSITVATRIDVPFLWVDALCIDQNNEEMKKLQIPMLDYIYEQAFATLIALGEHADSGLPGVNDGPKRSPQLIANFGAIQLISRCPTLSSQIDKSRWATRGWTYQEGLFSRRCIFFSDHQVYFHCSSMFCTEDSPSMINYSPDQRFSESFRDFGYRTPDMNYMWFNTVLRSRFQGGVHDRSKRMMMLAGFLQQYLSRQLSYDTDAINAFAALLSRLKRHVFPAGFVWGLPKDDFCDALLWTVNTTVTLRKRTRCEFPTWSWAAWTFDSKEQSLPFLLPYSDDVKIGPPLRMWLGDKLVVSSTTLSHESTHQETQQLTGLALELQKLWTKYQTQFQTPATPASPPSPEKAEKALLIDGPILTLRCKYDATCQAIAYDPAAEGFNTSLLPLIPPSAVHSSCEQRDFLVVKSEWVSTYRTYVHFGLMMLHWRDGGRGGGEGGGVAEAERGGVLGVDLEGDLDVFWRAAGVRRGRFWLV